MATKIGTIYALITADKKPLDKALVKARKSAVKGAGKIQAALSKINFKAVAIGAAAAGVAIAASLKKFVDLAIEQEKVERRLESVLRSTGEAAGYNIDQMRDMASAMQRVTTVGDEVILSGQAMLATFKQIRGQAFERATMAALDLSDVMQQDLRSSVVMVGKALNDPIANLGALGRAGIQFTKAQKDLIKTLWQTGRVAEAQVIILDELESQFGGAAKAAKDTLGGALKSLGNTFGDIGEKIGSGLKPVIMSYVESLEDWVEVNDQLLRQDIPSWLRSIGDALTTIKDFAGLRSVLETSAKAAALIKSGDLRITTLQWDQMGYLERQRLLDETLERMRQVDEHEAGRRGEGKSLKRFVEFKQTKVEPLPLPNIEKFELTQIESMDKIRAYYEKIEREKLELKARAVIQHKQLMEDELAAYIEMSNAEIKVEKQKLEEAEESASALKNISKDVAGDMAGSFKGIFVDAATGELDSFASYAESIFKNILNSFLNMAARMAAQQMLTSFGFESGGVVGLAKGGVVKKPTLFPFSGGTGLMGEAGPEGILPLARTRSGDLGVKATDGSNTKVVINNFSGAPAMAREQTGVNQLKTIFVTIGNDIKSGGPIGQAINQTYGVKRMGRAV